MYVDDKQGNVYHTGYIIDNLWITLFEVSEFRKLEGDLKVSRQNDETKLWTTSKDKININCDNIKHDK